MTGNPMAFLIITPMISVGGMLFSVVFVWWYTRKSRRVETIRNEGETIESAVIAVKSVADTRLDEIKMLREQLNVLTMQLAAQKTQYEADIRALERRVDDLETRNASLRRRLDRYEIEHEK